MTKTRQPILHLTLFVLFIISLGLTACSNPATNNLDAALTVKPATKTNSTTVSTIPSKKEATPTATSIVTSIASNSTTSPSVLTPSALPSKTLVQVFPVLANITEATAIRVQDDWYGWTAGGQGSETAHYSLVRNGNQFEGQAQFGLNAVLSKHATSQVTIPFSVAQDFLQTLTQIPIEEGDYAVYPSHSDDDPTISFQVDTPKGTLSFFTQAQNTITNKNDNPYNLPWGLYFAGRTFIVRSPIASQALAKLKPYFSEQVLNDILAEADQTPWLSLPEPTPTPINSVGTKGKLGQVFPQLSTLSTTTTLNFYYGWGGEKNIDSPYGSYSVSQQNNGFEGVSYFYRGDFNVITSKNINIPIDAVHSFLQDLLQVQIEERPNAQKNDYLQTFDFELETQLGIVRFSADANNNFSPMEMDFDGRVFTIKSDAVFKALAKIRPYLQEDTMKEMSGLPANYNGPLFSNP